MGNPISNPATGELNDNPEPGTPKKLCFKTPWFAVYLLKGKPFQLSLVL
jgi:hypothetical protein